MVTNSTNHFPSNDKTPCNTLFHQVTDSVSPLFESPPCSIEVVLPDRVTDHT